MWAGAPTALPRRSSRWAWTAWSLDPANADLGLRHHIKIGPRIFDITGLASPVTVAPANGRTLFAIGEPGHVELFRDWAPFVERLTIRLSGGAKAHGMFAQGRV